MALEILNREPTPGIAKRAVETCPLCDCPDKTLICNVQEHEYTTTTTDQFPLVCCGGCGAWYLDPRPDESALSIIYPPNYYIYVAETAKKATKKKGLWSNLAGALFKMRIKPIERHMKLDSNSRWLEVGCGNGSVLEALRDLYGVQGVGIDLSEQAVKSCRDKGFEAHVGRFEEFDLSQSASFDIVHSAHLIEHLSSPKEYMQKVFELLKPGGLCVFATPNTQAFEASMFGRHWGGLHVPRHWALLNADNARLIGEKAGFQHLETKYSTNGVFWSWSMHSILVSKGQRQLADQCFPSDHRCTSSSLVNLVRLGFFTMVDVIALIATGRTSNMLVIFRKPS